MNKLKITTIFAIILLSGVVMAAGLDRTVPTTVNPSDTFTVTYSTTGVPASNWFVAWDDTITGGCTPDSYLAFMAGTTADNDEKTVTFTAPSSGSCTFTGFYQYATETQTNFPDATITIGTTTGETCADKSGDVCLSTETCAVSFISASDTNRCCPQTCTGTTPPPTTSGWCSFSENLAFIGFMDNACTEGSIIFAVGIFIIFFIFTGRRR